MATYKVILFQWLLGFFFFGFFLHNSYLSLSLYLVFFRLDDDFCSAVKTNTSHLKMDHVVILNRYCYDIYRLNSVHPVAGKRTVYYTILYHPRHNVPLRYREIH